MLLYINFGPPCIAYCRKIVLSHSRFDYIRLACKIAFNLFVSKKVVFDSARADILTENVCEPLTIRVCSDLRHVQNRYISLPLLRF